MMGDGVKTVLTQPLILADQVSKSAAAAITSRQECLELKFKSDKLASLLRLAARRSDLYDRPARRIMADTEQALSKALSLVSKCRPSGVMRFFTLIPSTSFKKVFVHLDNSIGDLAWLLRLSSNDDDDEDEDDDDEDDNYTGGGGGLPPIAQNEPILFLIWQHIATLLSGNLDARSDAAGSLVSLARDNERFGKLIIEEDGVGPLLRLVKDGHVDGQENAARAIGLLGRDEESVEKMVQAGVCATFAKILKEGMKMKVQAMVAWAVAELAGNHPPCQDVFLQHNVIRLLVGHLAFETVEEHSKYTVAAMQSAALKDQNPDMKKHPQGGQNLQMHSVIQSAIAAKSNSQQQRISLLGNSHNNSKGRELEDPATKADMKAKAAKALWQLAKGNPAICKSITESKALLCFAVLLEKGTTDEVRLNSAMAVMEIACVAELDTDLRRTAFKPNSPAARAVIDQLVCIVERAGYGDPLLEPCVVALGCLSRMFRASETRIIAPLVRLLDERENGITRTAAVALTKFACKENHLHTDHAKSIINAGGARHLVQLVYFGDQTLQVAALTLLCHVAYHVPESEALMEAHVGSVMEWASKQEHMVQDAMLDRLLTEAKGRVELYNSKSTRGYH